MTNRPLAAFSLALSLSASVSLSFLSTTTASAAPQTVAPVVERATVIAAEHSAQTDHVEHAICNSAVDADRDKLEKGEVVVGMKNIGSTKFVTGKILINEPPSKVWPIMVNPFEFQGKISPRVKKVEVFTDEANLSVMRMTMDTSPLPFLPTLSYTVESKYEETEKGGRIEFRRVAGTLKDFRGYWDMAPADGGRKTELTYSMYLDPGFFVPQWIVREGVKGELPRTLTALRTRIKGVYEGEQRPERQTIVAADLNAVHHMVH